MPAARLRPPIYPPPQFPLRREGPFARTPPAVFPAILGLIELGMALRRGLWALALPAEVADLVLGAMAGLWAFAAVAYLAKVARRPLALREDLATLPGRAGLSAAMMGLMLLAGALGPVAPGVAQIVLWAGLALHLGAALLIGGALLRLPAEGRVVSPVFHMHFVGFIVGATSAATLGLTGVAMAILWLTLPVAVTIWGASLWQARRMLPPAPLRPLLAIHLAPASLFATTAALSGQVGLAQGFALLAAAIFLALLAAGRWILAAPFTPLWAALTFPLTAATTGALVLGGGWLWPGLGLLALAAGVIPMIGWRVLRLWPGGRLAALTNAARA